MKYNILARGVDLARHDPKKFVTLVFHLTLSVRPVSRMRLWFKILRRLRGATTRFELALVFSAILDTIVFTFRRRFALSPKSYFTGIVLSKKFGCSWIVRAGTDDIYNVMPEREGVVHNLIYSSLKKGDTFVDIGANIGYYTVLVSNLVSPRGKVIALEPMPETHQCLEMNCKLNQLRNVTLISKAAWSDECTMPMFVHGGYYGMASTTKGKGDSTSVRTIPLDTILKPYRHIKIIKIDAEEAEYQILCGAGSTLKKTKSLVIECGYDYDKIVSLLERSNFNIQKLAFTTYILAERKSSSKKDRVV